jgi:hypothetical protein
MIFLRRIAASGLVGFGLVLQACDGGPTGPNTGSLTVNVGNLPTEITAAVTVQGEVGTPPITVGATRTIPDLEPGVYTVTAVKAIGTKATYVPGTPLQTIEVVKGTTPAVVNIGYVLSTGIAAIAITGLPAGTDASVTIFNTTGFFANLKTSGEVGNLEPGEYTLQVDPVSGDEVYAGVTIQTPFAVTASPAAVALEAKYVPTTGTIQLSATGLPTGAIPVWDITGPNGFTATRRANESMVIPRLPPATYVVTARTFDFGAETYGAATPSQSIAVTAGVKAPAAFAYITRPPTLNLNIEGAYLTQSSQRFDGSVPLIAGRAAYLRVFVKANELNSATPRVRARFYRNGQLVQTSVMEPASQSVGTSVSERVLAESWGVSVPANLVTGGLSFIVDVDPDNTVREVNESDNSFPASGSGATPAVRAVPVLEVRFVPIETIANSLVGNVNEGRIPDLIGTTLRMFPIGASSIDIGAALSTNAPLLTPNGGQAWVQIINELNTRRVAEGTQRHYVGILKAPYTSGIVGLGFVPGKTTLSWDAPSAASTVAHELGHNWGRQHAPCGGPADPDPSFPYPNARIGVYGFDVVTGIVQDIERRDVMSYCGPEWVSDYTYQGVLDFRGSGAAASIAAAVQPTLVVWGRMENGNPILEPAFLAESRPVLPARDGRYRVQGFDAAGAQLFSVSFDPESVGDPEMQVRQFAFAIPMTTANAARISSLRLIGEGRQVQVSASPAGSPAVTASATAAEKVNITWNSSQFPMLVVRDPDTKEILAFARGGSTSVRTRKRTLDIAASNRVASTRVQIQARQ